VISTTKQQPTNQPTNNNSHAFTCRVSIYAQVVCYIC